MCPNHLGLPRNCPVGNKSIHAIYGAARPLEIIAAYRNGLKTLEAVLSTPTAIRHLVRIGHAIQPTERAPSSDLATHMQLRSREASGRDGRCAEEDVAPHKDGNATPHNLELPSDVSAAPLPASPYPQHNVTESSLHLDATPLDLAYGFYGPASLSSPGEASPIAGILPLSCVSLSHHTCTTALDGSKKVSAPPSVPIVPFQPIGCSSGI